MATQTQEYTFPFLLSQWLMKAEEDEQFFVVSSLLLVRVHSDIIWPRAMRKV